MRKILSIDGGGIRGMIPAIVLSEIERRTGRATSQLFDLIAGTSTGGILALALAAPGPDGGPRYSAEDLVSLYAVEGPRVFVRSLWHRINALENLLEEKYPSTGIERVLDEYFGETRLAEALTSLLITSYDIERRVPFFFKSHKAQREPQRDFPMKVVARATSAAPTYFEPERIDLPDGDYYALVDGGVFANNPGMCAYVEAMDRDYFAPDPDVLVVSLGTGVLTRRIPYEDAKGWGLAQWAQPLLSVVFDGVSDTVDYQLQELTRDAAGSQHYLRFQPVLDEGNDDLDDVSRTNVRVLRLLAENLVVERRDDIERVCQMLAG